MSRSRIKLTPLAFRVLKDALRKHMQSIGATPRVNREQQSLAAMRGFLDTMPETKRVTGSNKGLRNAICYLTPGGRDAALMQVAKQLAEEVWEAKPSSFGRIIISGPYTPEQIEERGRELFKQLKDAPRRADMGQRFELALEFARRLRKEIGEHRFALVRARNRKEEHSNVCHSHDFCDANMVMSPAFKKVTGFSYRMQEDSDIALWSAAWDIAKTTILK